MKLISLLFNASLFIVLIQFSCKKEEEESCPANIDLGQLSWSKETENWFPSKYVTQFSNLGFESENGDNIGFDLLQTDVLEGFFESTDIPCENGDGTTHVRWADRRYVGAFMTPDSMYINVGIGVWNESLALRDVDEADFYDWIGVIVYRIHNGRARILGRIRIVTDLRNAELDEIDHSPENYERLENFKFMGDIYPEIYQEPNPDHSLSNIFFEKGKGVIGFIDENGTRWKLIE